ncbi:selenide, water dikinase SelD [Saccharospirillum alexandrii]|uniref:selenide, water dikinase SelD n=1 Tax=Saccharospirillum alexandrii TaxID=2448477 RepID=UPI0013DEA74F|nr:selenide, water dikinase SelD [Saccharospirillum alexandrii]
MPCSTGWNTSAMFERDLVLVGGGHTHALMICTLAMKPIPGVRVTLVSESTLTPYSGMLPGLVAGHYRPDEVHIDLNRLCRWAGIRFIQGRVTGVNPSAKTLSVEQQPTVSYDKVSFDTGSTPDLSLPGARSFAVGVKPVSRFYAKWQQLLDRHDLERSTETQHWGVVGAGAGGVELVLAMAYRLGADRRVQLHLVYPGDHILSGYPRRSVLAAERALQRHGVVCHSNFNVSAVKKNGLVAANGNALSLDQTVWCTRAAGPEFLSRSGLDVTSAGFIAVNRYLQSTSHPDVFAAGDVADMVFDPRPKAGVYAVRQAPILYQNLKLAFASQPMQPARLQRRFLSLLSLGDRQAVGHRGLFVASGAWVWRWKDRIDRAFMDKFQALGTPKMMAPMPNETEGEMHCAGCGSKLGPAILHDTLSALPRLNKPGLTPALEAAEDASLWQPTPGLTQVQSLDGFRSFSDDLYRFGQVCVNHALSDLYAMGAQPVSAQVWINLAHAHPRLHKADFQRLMRGIHQSLNDQQVALAGGHSTEGAETHVAVVANGEVDPACLWRKTGAQPGDVLILTKPLGTGVIWASDAAAQAPARAVAAAWESMLVSQKAAWEALQRLEPHAVTDVTGFGLLGHLLEMVTGDDFEAHLNLNALPALPGARDLLEHGFRSSLHPQLLPYTLECSGLESVSEADIALLIDPQTSGGLLVALDPDQAEAFLGQLPNARAIGHIARRTSDRKVVVG